jgi:uncharacterized iron-regulated membrane protein
MKITLRKFHKYISLIVSIQLLLWTISGIYFSFNKIESVRGEQYRLENNAFATDEKKQTEMLSTEDAKKIVSLKTTLTPIQSLLIDEKVRGSEFRGRNLPLYKVISENEKGKEINVYIDPFSGEISAIRSLQWRIWDFMWGIHIMDWVERDNIDNLWLKVFSFIALFTSLSGIILFFNRRTLG